MPVVIVGLIFLIWVVKSLMKLTPGVSRMPAGNNNNKLSKKSKQKILNKNIIGVLMTKMGVPLARSKPILGVVPKMVLLAMNGPATLMEIVNILAKKIYFSNY